ncbi:uncharacterized protein [Drosophila bipectinata]|uniref:uncharacterized protein n=1 Tax=Drosophila bipectinata TaxID=42026 RepID=UPI0007E6F4B2|nr:uncharacterized protein LOC108129445 [Drosophila bipectinata]
MPPNLFYILFWRLAVEFLYPYAYMECSLQDALLNEQLVWSKGSPKQQQMLLFAQETLQDFLMFVLILDLIQRLNAAIDVLERP